MTIRTISSFQKDEFYDTLLKVDGDRFFHENFQFRFMNYGRLSGPYDTWNIDYVYLNKNRTPNDRYLPDRTIISSLTNLFNDYRAVPYDHFLLENLFPILLLMSSMCRTIRQRCRIQRRERSSTIRMAYRRSPLLIPLAIQVPVLLMDRLELFTRVSGRQ